MANEIKSAIVIGAGVMGAGIAAHIANNGYPVLLLDRIPPELTEQDKQNGLTEDSPAWRNSIAATAIEGLKRSKRPVFTSEEAAGRVSAGNTTDHIAQVANYDWVLETIFENLEIKRFLYSEIEKYRKPGLILTTNTSGLPIHKLVDGYSEDFNRCFMGTHFFNPPTYAKLIEIIPGPGSDADVVAFMVKFLTEKLGKTPLVVKDTPNFICNRLGIFTSLNAIDAGLKQGFKVEEVDELCGKSIARMQTAVHRMADAVGIDTVALVTQNIHTNAPDDERRALFQVPAFMKKMIESGWLGDKVRKGFYAVQKSDGAEPVQLVLDIESLTYRAAIKPDFECLTAAEAVKDPAEKLRIMVAARDRGALFAWQILTDDLIYAVNRVGEIADRLVDIDVAMKLGYSWRMGPFEAWDAIGVRSSVDRMVSEGRPVPQKILDMLASGAESFYKQGDAGLMFYDFASGKYVQA